MTDTTRNLMAEGGRMLADRDERTDKTSCLPPEKSPDDGRIVRH